MTDAAFTSALIAELARKTGVSWVTYTVETRQGPSSRTQAVWHVWFDDALCLVSGGTEQHLPGIADASRVEVTMRSKESGGRLVTWAGSVSVVRPDDEQWEPVTAALVADRLNLEDLSTAAAEWARTGVVTRIVPTGEVVEHPGDLSTDSHAAPPPPTPAITRGALPKVLHRRVRRRPKLS